MKRQQNRGQPALIGCARPGTVQAQLLGQSSMSTSSVIAGLMPLSARTLAVELD